MLTRALTLFLVLGPIGQAWAYETNAYEVKPHGKTFISFGAGHAGTAATEAWHLHRMAAWLERERTRLVAAKQLPDRPLVISIADPVMGGRDEFNRIWPNQVPAKGKGESVISQSWDQLPDPKLLILGLLRTVTAVENEDEVDEFLLSYLPDWNRETLEQFSPKEPLPFWDVDLAGRKGALYWVPATDREFLRFDDGKEVLAPGGFRLPPQASPDGNYFSFATPDRVLLMSRDLQQSWSYAIPKLEDPLNGGIALAFSDGSSRFYIRIDGGACSAPRVSLTLPLDRAELMDLSQQSGPESDGESKLPQRFPKRGAFFSYGLFGFGSYDFETGKAPWPVEKKTGDKKD